MGPPPPASLATTPHEFLKIRLALSADQDKKIADIQTSFRGSMRPGGRGPMGWGGGPGPMGQGGPGPMGQGERGGLRQADQAASSRIESLLTDEQKKDLPSVLAEVEALRAAGLPLEVYSSLKLTADQEKAISAIGSGIRPQARAQGATDQNRPDPRQIRESTRTKIRALLNDKQRLVLAEYMVDHHGPGFGPDGGRGPQGDDQMGPPPGGPGGDDQMGPPPGGPQGDDQMGPPPGGPGGDDQMGPPPGGPGGDDQGPPPPDQGQ